MVKIEDRAVQKMTCEKNYSERAEPGPAKLSAADPRPQAILYPGPSDMA